MKYQLMRDDEESRKAGDKTDGLWTRRLDRVNHW